jgi:hypothetical protein
MKKMKSEQAVMPNPCLEGGGGGGGGEEEAKQDRNKKEPIFSSRNYVIFSFRC